jgi:type VI secretion system protein ImpC
MSVLHRQSICLILKSYRTQEDTYGRSGTTSPAGSGPGRTGGKGLLDQIIDEGRMAREESQKAYAKDLISEFVGQVMEGTMTISKDTEAMINARIAQIDKLISDQLNEVMHHEEFQKLEGSWRGLHYLVSKSETGERMKIRVMNVNKKDLLKDMEKASEFDQSAMFKKIYEEEFGMFGGAAYGALIGDYEFGNHPQDLAFWRRCLRLPLLPTPRLSPQRRSSLFNLDSFTETGQSPRPVQDFSKRRIRQMAVIQGYGGLQICGACVPHILMRQPYGQANVPVEAFNFEENVDGTDHSKYLWGNAAYALGTR